MAWGGSLWIEKEWSIRNSKLATSGQDGGIGRHTVLPHTKKKDQKKDNNNLKTKKQPELTENQLYGSPTTKEIKKKHSFRPGQRGRDGQLRWRGLAVRRQLEDPGRQSHICADKPGRTTGEWDRPHNPGFQRREIKPQNLWRLWHWWEKFPASQESSLERPTGA